MKIQEIITFLESVAAPVLQEGYDNAGLLTGSSGWDCTGIITTLDATEEVVLEAIEKKCNLIVAHHPIIFGGLKKITGRNYVEKTVITAIKNDIAIYAIHTNLDNVLHGVSGVMADKLGLINRTVLQPKNDTLKKLYTFVPVEHAEKVRSAIFAAGAGHISNYSECSFNIAGQGTFKPGEGSDPFVGKPGIRHTEDEIKMEMIFPAWLEKNIIIAMNVAHPYEEVAYDIVSLDNQNRQVGSGLVGELAEPMNETDFLKLLKERFNLSVIRHTPLRGKKVKKWLFVAGPEPSL